MLFDGQAKEVYIFDGFIVMDGCFRLTAVTQLTHHGMLFVPIGYTFGAGMFKMDEPKGGSPYGAGTFAGDGTRTPSESELGIADHQGRLTANVAKLLATK
jgi:NAD(P)H dehydrogenase (quinone)